MTTEDRLRRALAASAATVTPAPDAWARIRARTTAGRHRRMIPALVTASAVVVGVIGVLALTGGEGAQQVVTEPPASQTPVPGETPDSTATPPAAAPLPETFLAVRDHATELVVVETATGTVLRTLVDLGDFPAGGTEEEKNFWPYFDGVALSPDGDTAFYSVGPEPAPSTLYRVAVAGGAPERIGDGAHPQVSPDGRYLAWAVGPIQSIAVRDLGTGETHMVEPSQGFDQFPGALAWAPTSRHLAFESRTTGPSDVGNASRIRVVDAVTARRMAESRVLAAEPGRSLHLVGFRAFDGLLGVLESAPEADGGETFAVRDPDGGAVRGRLDLPFTATAAVYDRSGRHQLFVDQDGAVHRRSGGPFTAIPDVRDVSLVAW